MSKRILVIGGTGAQGIAVIDALLGSDADGVSSPYTVRVLTRNPEGHRAQSLKSKGCELAIGSVTDFTSIWNALQDCYGVYCNTDGFTLGEAQEMFAGFRIFELAKQTGTIKHYVWSNLDYLSKKGKFDPKYRVGHYDGKGRVAELLKTHESDTDSMVWSSLTTGPYMEMLYGGLFIPMRLPEDPETAIWALPLGNGHMPIITLKDLGFWARYIFDHRTETSGKDLEVASQMLNWNDVVLAYKKVTGKPAIYIPVELDQYFDALDKPDEFMLGGGTITFRQNFSGFWNAFKDDVIKRDMNWIKNIHPGSSDVESWMREVGYTGIPNSLLKNVEDGGNVQPVLEKIRALVASVRGK